MQRFLTLYLTTTGIGATLALLAPGLIVIGLFLFVIPGLLLSLAPTAFLWGCVFAGAWLAARSVLGENWKSVLAAAGLAPAALMAFTIPNHNAGQASYRSSRLPDVAPPRPIAMRGDVRLDLPYPRWDNLNRGGRTVRGFSCDNFCVALLFTPGVTSVTMDKSSSKDDHSRKAAELDPEARTYRLVPKSECGNRGIIPDLTGGRGLFRGTLEEGVALDAEWNLKLAGEVCLTRSAPIGKHDLLVRHVVSRPPRRSDWSLRPGDPVVEYVVILDSRDELLLRRFKTSVQVLSRLLHVGVEGGIENFRFGWGTTILSNKPRYDAIDLTRELQNHTTTVGKPDVANLLPRLREALGTALADDSLTAAAPAFKLIGAYFKALPSPLSAEDLMIVTGLARDDRVTRYESIWDLKPLPEDQQRAIRAAFVRRALESRAPVRLANSGAEGFLDRMPDGSFSSLTSAEEQLLRLPDKRWALPTLIGRLHEGGPRRVPLLLTLIREHSLARRRNAEDERAKRIRPYSKSAENEGHQAAVHAARRSLCILGPDASVALLPLQRLLTPEIVGERELSGSESVSWQFVLARLGYPVDRLSKPANWTTTEEAYRKSIRDKVARFDPKRHC